MRFIITLDGLDTLQARLATFPQSLQDALITKSQNLAQALADKVRDDKLSGEVLKSRSGRLKDSIQSSVGKDGDEVKGNVFVSGDVSYAAIQEYGGTTKAHIIEASNAKVLTFPWQGKTAFLARVHHPGSVIPERSYLRSALEDSREDVISDYQGALSDVVNSF